MAAWIVDTEISAAALEISLGGALPTHRRQLTLVAGCEWRGSGVFARTGLRRTGLGSLCGHGTTVGFSSALSGSESKAERGETRRDAR